MPAAHLNWHPKAFTFALTDSAPTLFLHIDEDAHKHHIVSQRHQSLPEMPFCQFFQLHWGYQNSQPTSPKATNHRLSIRISKKYGTNNEYGPTPTQNNKLKNKNLLLEMLNSHIILSYKK